MWKKVSASALALSIAVVGMTNIEQASAKKVDEVTRGEYVKTVIEAMDVELGSGKTVNFKDVPDSLKPYIEKAIELQLIEGKTDKRFAPEGKMTLEEAVVSLVHMLDDDKTYSEDTLKKYKDYHAIKKKIVMNLQKRLNMGF